MTSRGLLQTRGPGAVRTEVRIVTGSGSTRGPGEAGVQVPGASILLGEALVSRGWLGSGGAASVAVGTGAREVRCGMNFGAGLRRFSGQLKVKARAPAQAGGGVGRGEGQNVRSGRCAHVQRIGVLGRGWEEFLLKFQGFGFLIKSNRTVTAVNNCEVNVIKTICYSKVKAWHL